MWFVSEIRIQFFCSEPACYVAEPGHVRVVAVDTGAGVERLNPEGGGVVVATVKPDIRVHQDEDLLVYQSTKQLRIAGSGFERVSKASEGVCTSHSKRRLTPTERCILDYMMIALVLRVANEA